ncbi:tetratricopeptide repeat protein [Paenibacillus allorhizosphaerae]|uniref:Tetratricopeptide repeat protein n=1 Tax=Paenibacillus allorhizosphaerae TaxID=2849866 RepID=A0ABN7TNR2_9BACL|nr:tetratricopeptide repeat protein [Paenibacillus allorhizosphaerae]CAG7648821.1 hypothetical protein PAECIP111802_04336 [Paenibacillus allorhizosphaerae]
MSGEEAIKKAYESILKHDFAKAVVWFERAIALDPDCAAYHYKLSITYARSNKLEQATLHAKEAVRLDPDDEHYTMHYRHLQAKELLFQAEKLFEESDEQLYLAVALLKQAVDLDPLSVEAYLLLSIAYSQLEDYSHAIRAVKELLKLDPNHPIASRLLEEYGLKWKQYMQTASPKEIKRKGTE